MLEGELILKDTALTIELQTVAALTYFIIFSFVQLF